MKKPSPELEPLLEMHPLVLVSATLVLRLLLLQVLLLDRGMAPDPVGGQVPRAPRLPESMHQGVWMVPVPPGLPSYPGLPTVRLHPHERKVGLGTSAFFS